jgi:poly(A) polymerase
LPVNGRDILNHKLAEGPDVGACLRRLEAMWVESGFSLSRDQLLEEAKRG